MVLARWQGTITDEAGNLITDPNIEVRRESVGAPLVSLFADREGQTTLGNPFIGGSDGYAAFHVPGGAYRIRAYKGAFERTWRYVPIGLAAEHDGVPAGVSFIYDDATGDADPGVGLFRFNNADPGSATEIYVSDTDANGVDQSGWLISLDDGGDVVNRGTLVLRTADNSALVIARLQSTVADAGGYRRLSISILAASATSLFVPGAQFGLLFARAGADGADGAGSGDVVGPDGGVVAGQFVAFADVSGKQIEGSNLGDSPPTPIRPASDADIHAAMPGKVMHMGQLASAAAPAALSFAATVAIDWTAAENFELTMTGNGALGNPSAAIPGQTRTVLVQGDGGTARTLSFGNQYGGELPTLDDITATKKYLVVIYCKSAGQFLAFAHDGSDA